MLRVIIATKEMTDESEIEDLHFLARNNIEYLLLLDRILYTNYILKSCDVIVKQKDRYIRFELPKDTLLIDEIEKEFELHNDFEWYPHCVKLIGEGYLCKGIKYVKYGFKKGSMFRSHENYKANIATTPYYLSVEILNTFDMDKHIEFWKFIKINYNQEECYFNEYGIRFSNYDKNKILEIATYTLDKLMNIKIANQNETFLKDLKTEKVIEYDLFGMPYTRVRHI